MKRLAALALAAGSLGLGLAIALLGAGSRDPGTPYAQIERQLQRRPADARAWVLKARLDLEAGRHDLAASAYGRALEREARVARDPGVWVEYAEALAHAQGGRLRGGPQRALERALALDGRHAQALDLAGSAAWEAGDYAAAAQHWRTLLGLWPQAEADAGRRAALARALQAAEQRVRLSLPAAR